MKRRKRTIVIEYDDGKIFRIACKKHSTSFEDIEYEINCDETKYLSYENKLFSKQNIRSIQIIYEVD